MCAAGVRLATSVITLRSLAAHGFVEETPEPAAEGRERWLPEDPWVEKDKIYCACTIAQKPASFYCGSAGKHPRPRREVMTMAIEIYELDLRGNCGVKG